MTAANTPHRAADEFEADVRAVVEELLKGVFAAAFLNKALPLDSTTLGSMTDLEIARTFAAEAMDGESDASSMAHMCILALVGRRMAAREAAKGGR